MAKKSSRSSAYEISDSIVKSATDEARLAEGVSLLRRSGKVDFTHILFSVVEGEDRESLLIEPGAQPISVNWGGVAIPKYPHWRAFGRLLKRVFRYLANLVSLLLLVLVIFQLCGLVTLRNVATGSMAPAIPRNSIEVSVPVRFDHPKIGSVVIYELKSSSHGSVGPVSHRIIAGNGQTGWVLKGDANKFPDNQHPTTRQLLGIVVLSLPSAGKFLTLRNLIYLVIGVVLLWFLTDFIKRRRKLVHVQ
jgi:signal peptidase I